MYKGETIILMLFNMCFHIGEQRRTEIVGEKF